jgi:pimeloyl-ACP methyl ester carboxylesterase
MDTKFPARIRTLTVLSTPHHDALVEAARQDDDQRQRSKYIEFFRMPSGSPEGYIAADDFQFLRRVWQGKVPEDLMQRNIRRFSEPGALTAALNWYRAWDTDARIGQVSVPSLYLWGTADMAVGAVGAVAAAWTARYTTGPYHFEQLDGKSHWLVEEASDLVAQRIVRHIKSAN